MVKPGLCPVYTVTRPSPEAFVAEDAPCAVTQGQPATSCMNRKTVRNPSRQRAPRTCRLENRSCHQLPLATNTARLRIEQLGCELTPCSKRYSSGSDSKCLLSCRLLSHQDHDLNNAAYDSQGWCRCCGRHDVLVSPIEPVADY